MAPENGADGMGLAVDQRLQKGLRGARVRDDAAGVSWSPWTYSAATRAAELLPWPIVVAIMHGPGLQVALQWTIVRPNRPEGRASKLSTPRTCPLVLTPPHIPE